MTAHESPEPARRSIGWVGRVGRVVGGVCLIVAAFLVGPVDWVDAGIGLVVLPTITTLALRLRGSDSPPLRWVGPVGHVANVLVAGALAALALQAALLFYGAAMLVAAIYRYAGCEVLAFANRFNGRTDEIGCPVFTPIDAIERRTSLG